MTKKVVKKSQRKSGTVKIVDRKRASNNGKKVVGSAGVAQHVSPAKPVDRNNDILVIRVPTVMLNYLGMKAVEVEHERAKLAGDKMRRTVGAATLARNILISWIAEDRKK